MNWKDDYWGMKKEESIVSMELYRQFKAILSTVREEFEREHNCEVNVKVIDVQPNEED